MKRKYNPNSKRSIAGKQFQDKVLFELKNYFSDIEDFRDRKRNQGIERGTPYTESELSILEKSFGDLTFTIDGQRHYIECCWAMGETFTRMCELKRVGFIGNNKWYCFGKRVSPDDRIYIPSRVWHAYLDKLELKKGHGWCYREIPLKYIGENLRAAILGNEEFKNKILGVNNGRSNL